MQEHPRFPSTTQIRREEQPWRGYWEQARRNGPDPGSKVRRIPEQAMAKGSEGEKQGRFLLFFRRLLDYVVLPERITDLAIAVLRHDGILLECAGDPAMIGRLEEIGLARGADLSLSAAGLNAVGGGLAASRRVWSTGEDNYLQCLQKYALYFAPVNMRAVSPPFEREHIGGICVIVPADCANENYQLLATGTALHMIAELHHFQRHYRRYRMTGRGLLTVDMVMKDAPRIRYAEQPLFDMLGLPEQEEELRFRPLSELINPYPSNKRFWEIVEKREEVEDLELRLTIGRRSVECIITTDSYYQPAMEVEGMHFFLTTPQWIARTVSDRVGNNAVSSFDSIVGESAAIRSVKNRARLIAGTDSNVIILGESGVGKDVFAQAIHNSGSRSGKPFIAVNCGALSRDLIASELFGYEEGAFTGAKKKGNIGKFELANGGTLFLDEIGELPMDMQATLLRAVEQKKITRLGGTREIEVDVRVISATNADIPEMIDRKLFREDLYYRLSTFELRIPPLRARGGDIELLAQYFADRAAARYGRTEPVEISPDSMSLLRSLEWRGNVRELQNLLEGIVQLYPGKMILPYQITENLRVVTVGAAPSERSASAAYPLRNLRRGDRRLEDPLLEEPVPQKSEPPHTVTHSDTENGADTHRAQADTDRHDLSYWKTHKGNRAGLTEDQILEALAAVRGNRSEAAVYLGVSRRTFYRYMEKYGL